MNSVLHRQSENEFEGQQSDREINLSATLILVIFFVAALVCAVFFGFGYSMGRKSLGGAPVLAEGAVQVANPPTALKVGAGAKPTAGSAGVALPQKAGPTVAVPMVAEVAVASVLPREPANPESLPVVPAVPARAVAADAGGAMVQVAAVSHQEDADLLVNTLKRRGYAVAIHTEAQDKLLHVQVGPFASHKEADAMRQKLLAEGFNAIVKDTK